MSRRIMRILLVALAVAAVMLPAACKLTTESQRTVEEKVAVPGMQEALKARDMAIAAAVSVSLSADPEIAQNKLTVECRDAKVILKGVVPSQELKDRAEKLARAQEDVRDVLNEITVDTSLADQRFSLDDTNTTGGTDTSAPSVPQTPSTPNDNIGNQPGGD
jgi:osmotically-inducible protein OsmY